ncbi:MAG: nucleotide pyrophosphatase, partial [Thermoprotei archaeon]
DSAPPRIVYEGYGVELGALKELGEDGARFIMRSCHPPITIPAWMVMFTGRTPGELGIYGFRHRRPGDVKESYIVNSNHVKAPTLWNILGGRGLRVGVVGVPPTYPPKPVHGFLVTDFTTPDPSKPYTFPPWLKREIEERYGSYIFDVVYRSHEKDRVAKEVFQMTRQHLQVVTHLLLNKKWDLFIYVEVGVDRVQHAFWKYFDEQHPRHVKHPVYSRVIPEYYRMIDTWLGEVRKLLPRDTILVVLSDHGAKAMKGAFVVNQWLQEQGYLKLREEPKRPGQDLGADMIDWQHTVAWGWGGYYSRIFINLRGREPHGIVEKRYYEDTVKQLKEDIARIKGPSGEQWQNWVYTPYELYPRVEGDAPDLIAYFDDLSWRAAGTLGWNTKYLPENDRGPDDAVHDWNGVLAIYDPEETLGRGDKGVVDAGKVFSLLLRLATGQ